MTVTMTFCDRCGGVVPEGKPVEKMVLNAHEYDLCADCYKVLTADLQSKGRPVPEVEPPWKYGQTGAIGPSGAQGSQGAQGAQGSPVWFPNTIGIAPYQYPTYPNGGSGTWQPSPGVTYTLTNGVAVGAVLNDAISNAAATIGSAIATSNAAYFSSSSPSKN